MQNQSVLRYRVVKTVGILGITGCWLLGGSLGRVSSAEHAQEANLVTQPPARPEFFNAIQGRDTKTVKQILLDDPAQANAVNFGGDSALLLAIRSSNAEMVKLLFAANANPNLRDSSRQPSIFSGMDMNNLDILSLLGQYGAELNANSRQGRTPLTCATLDGAQEMTKLFLKMGAKPDVADQRGMLPLDAAILNKRQELTKVFLESGASVTARSSSGSTPLHAAVWSDDPEIIKSVLQKGADPNAATRAGDTPLHIAALKFSSSLPTLLAAGADPNRRDAQGDLPLHLALRRLGSDIASGTTEDPLYPPEWRGAAHSFGTSAFTDDEVTRVLTPLVEKSDINARDRLGISPLLLAVLSRQPTARDLINAHQPRTDSTTQLFNAVAGGDTAMVEKLLTAKPFLVYFRLPDGMTPLHVAALWGSRGAVELLLQKGADIDARDARGMTPLRLCTGRAVGAYAKRMQVMMQLLLEHKAAADARDEEGVTPLLGAARVGNYGLIGPLIAAKADPSARDTRGETILHVLSKSPDKATGATATLLLKSGAEADVCDQDNNTALALAVRERDLELVKALLGNGCNPDPIDANGKTPLISLEDSFWISDASGTEDFVNALLQGGANPNAALPYGDSILLRAVYARKKNIVSLLLDYKSDPNGVRGAGNDTPLTRAVSNYDKVMVTLLLEKGADPTRPNANGETPLSIAQRNRNQEVIALLQAKIDGQKIK